MGHAIAPIVAIAACGLAAPASGEVVHCADGCVYAFACFSTIGGCAHTLDAGPPPDRPSRDRQHEQAQLQREILQEYLHQQRRRDTVVAKVEKRFGKSFPAFTEKDYTLFMSGLDLSRDEHLSEWSHVTGIPILALTRSSNFFYTNAHLIADIEAAIQMKYADLMRIRTDLDRKTGRLRLQMSDGQPLRTRNIPKGTIQLTERTGDIIHTMNFAEDRTVLEVLEPYLIRLRDVEHRGEIEEGIRLLPLSAVKVLRGKAIYVTSHAGRSYTVAMAVSNDIYAIFAGMQPAVFVDSRPDGGTVGNFVHELGHLIDYTVIQGAYGNFHHPYQFPEFRKRRAEKEHIFGRGDEKVPQTAYGYISKYSKANAQENFADHFRAYIQNKEVFRGRAQKEQSQEHPQLMDKFRFMEELLERTPTTMRRLSREHLEK